MGSPFIKRPRSLFQVPWELGGEKWSTIMPNINITFLITRNVGLLITTTTYENIQEPAILKWEIYEHSPNSINYINIYNSIVLNANKHK